MTDPIDRIEWLPADSLVANHYNPNVVNWQELALLETSILGTGWIQPILINRARVIIDGFHRWSLSLRSPAMLEKYAGRVPVATIDVDTPGAMMMTIRINRAKGTHVAVKMSEIVHTLLNDHKLDPHEIAVGIGANLDEVQLLAQDGIFQARKLDKLPFSPAWVPKDTPRVRRRTAPVPQPARGNAAQKNAAGPRPKP